MEQADGRNSGRRRRGVGRRVGRVVARWCVVLPVLYGLWCGMLWFKQEDLIFPRHIAGPKMQERSIPGEVERIWIKIRTPYEGLPPRVEAWFLRGEPGAPLAVYFHGNGELIDHCLDAVGVYRRRGYHVLIPEYRGYGRSAGTPSERGIVEDAVRFVREVEGREGVDGSRVVYHGRSLGSGVAAQVALERAPAGLVLESPFSSVARFARGYGAPTFLVRHPFRTDEALLRIEPRPRVLILHGRGDEIVPFAHAETLRRIAPWSAFQELSGSHVAAIESMPGAWGAIERLLEEVEKGGGGAGSGAGFGAGGEADGAGGGGG